MIASCIPRRRFHVKPVIEKYVFVPNEATLSTEESIRVNVQIVLENSHQFNVKFVEVFDEGSDDERKMLGPNIVDILRDQPLVNGEVAILSLKNFEIDNVKVSSNALRSEQNALMVIVCNGLNREKVLYSNF